MPVSAQTAAADARTAADEPLDDDFHNRRTGEMGDIIVTATGLRQLDILSGTSVVEGLELQREQNGQIGEVLAKLPGVSASSFAPGASRPVLRGLQGERVRVLIDGIGTIDVSNTSVDHAVTVEPLTTERVEVIRGPATLLYGNQAIGGVVNVIDKRIPLRPLDEPFHLDTLFAGNSAANLYEGGGSLDIAVGQNLVVHVDGSYRNTDDLSIGGAQVAPLFRAALLDQAAQDIADGDVEGGNELIEAANQRDVLPNSFTETFSGNAGFAIFAGGGTLGASVGIYDTNYGVPGRPGFEEGAEEEGGEEEEGEEEGVSIDLRQYRADLRGELPLGGGFFEMLKTRIGYSDYTHTEFEGSEVGTVFEVQGIEARAELVQAQRNGLGGGIGLQYTFRDFQAIGEEAFVAPNETETFAVFAVQEYGPGPLQLELGARYENTSVDSPPLGIDRDFDTFSASVGLAYEVTPGLRLGANVSRAERAPGGEELYANGPHIATQAFEIGDPDLDTEKSLGGEVFVRGNIAGFELAASAYYTSFDRYIFDQANGEIEDGLPVFLILQDDAEFYGIEGEVRAPLYDGNGFGVTADLRASYVRAEFEDGANVPRIPPLSLLGALEADAGPIVVRGEVQYTAEQNRNGEFELPTDDFTFVNASIAYRPAFGRDRITVLAQVDNIFDTVGRRHASFTKDFVPLAGRNFRLSVRSSF